MITYKHGMVEVTIEELRGRISNYPVEIEICEPTVGRVLIFEKWYSKLSSAKRGALRAVRRIQSDSIAVAWKIVSQNTQSETK